MTLFKNANTVLAFLFIFTVYVTPAAYAQENFRVSYGGYNGNSGADVGRHR
jgi:hypothetical protein